MRNKLVMMLTLFVAFLLSGISVAAEEGEEEVRQIEDEIIYEIIVDRYSVGDHSKKVEVDVENPKTYHGGDFLGITNQLDDLVDIGVSTLVLSPIMSNAEDGYHGYWIEDFTEIEEHFGTLEDFETLISESHERGIKVVLEFVPNYVSVNHSVATDPDYEDWILTDEVTGPDWTEGVVQLDLDHDEVQAFITEAAMFWLDETDIDGLQLHAVDQSSLDFLSEFTGELKREYPNMLLLGDILDDSADIEDIMDATELDAIDDYSVGQMYSDVLSKPDQPPVDIFEEIKESGDFQSIVMVDDKYSKRFTHKFSENGRNPVTTWKLALTMMYTSPGTPQLFQGSEYGMYGETPEDAQRLVTFPGGDQDLIEFHNRISSLRTEFPALKKGDYELVGATDSFVVYKRTYEDQVFYVAINNGSESAYIDVTDVEEGMMFRGYLEDNVVRANSEGVYRLGIPRESVEVYQLMEDAGYNWFLIIFVVAVLGTFVGVIAALERKQKQQEKANQETKK